MEEKYVALATIGAALVSGMISLVNLTVSKEHKISELRQIWIDEVRSDVSKLISSCNHIVCQYVCAASLGPVNYWKFNIEHLDEIKQIDELHHRIKLRLNIDEHEKIIWLLDDIERSISQVERLRDLDQMNTLFKCLHDHSQTLFKSEWERVKTGELGFRNLKRIGFTMVAASSLFFIYFYHNGLFA